jgi:ABC-2 type transport system ATP-binding protein
MEAISASNLTKRYGRIDAVHDMSFSIEPGEVVGFLGPNGAGKTTTLRMLAGLIRPTSGSGTILGKPVPGPTLREVGTMIEEPSFYPYLTGRNNLRHAAYLHGGVSDARIDEVLHFVHMENAATKRVAAYSQGMRQRLGLARALLWEPRVLLLDEPTNGLDPVGIAEIRENLRQIGESGVTILVSSHILAELEKFVERVLVVEKGRLLFDGKLQQLLTQLGSAEVAYRLQAADSAALQKALLELGYESVLLPDGQVRVTVPEQRAEALLGELYSAGVSVQEARREHESLEEAYLRLLREDGRPS